MQKLLKVHFFQDSGLGFFDHPFVFRCPLLLFLPQTEAEFDTPPGLLGNSFRDGEVILYAVLKVLFLVVFATSIISLNLSLACIFPLALLETE